MAIGRISGQVLRSALYRDGIDIYFANTPSDTELLYLNVNNNRVGINNGAPVYELDVTGTVGSTAIQTLQINVGDLLLENNKLLSTDGNLILAPATSADQITLDGNVSISTGLTVDQNIESTNGSIIAGSLEIGGINLSEDANGNQKLTTDSGDFIIEPAAGSSFNVEGKTEFNGAVELTNGNDLIFTDSFGNLTLTIDAETGNVTSAGLFQPEELQVDDIYIHDNVIEVNTPDTDLIIKAGNADSAGSLIPNIVLQSETTIIKPFRVNGIEAKIIVDGMLEIDNNKIEAYASDLNLTVNNVGDSTVNFINLNGNTEARGSIFVRDEVVSPNVVVDTIEATTNDINVYPATDRFFIINEKLQVIKDIQGTLLTIDDVTINGNEITSVDDLIIRAALNKDVLINSDTFFNNLLESPIIRSSDTIEGKLLDIDNVRIDGNTVTSISGPLNLRVGDPLTQSIFFNTSLDVQGNIHATGNITADGNIVLGNENTDNITFNADVNSNILPDINSDGTTGYTFGSDTKFWKNIYTKNLTIDDYTVNKINNNDLTYLPTNDTNLITEGGMIRYFNANLAFNSGDNIPLGWSEDSTYNDGAFYRSATSDVNGVVKLDEISSEIKIAEAIDLLNEAMNNIRNNTFIRSVDFAAVPTAAGSGSQITLNLNVDGNHNRVEVDWDVDGRFDELVTLLQGTGYTKPANANNSVYTGNVNSVSFIYDAPLGGFFTVKVVVRNTSAQIPGSAGTDAEEVKIDYLTIYTPDPDVDFDLYRTSSGGTALSGNLLYVIEENALFLENLTTNTGGIFPNTATYTVDWGDGTTPVTIASDNDPGGRYGARLSHVFADGTQTGTGSTSITLTLTSHTTADPAVIPTSESVIIKIYEKDPAVPNSLNTKSIAFASTAVNGSAGAFTARLAHNATINTATPSTSTGSVVSRTTKTTGTIESTVISTFAYSHAGNASGYDINDQPFLNSFLNRSGTADGTITFSNSLGNNTTTNNSLVVTQESDYNLLDATGSSISFANSIYYPDAFFGFRAKVATNAPNVPVGLNSFRLSFTSPAGTFDTNEVEYVKDSLTAIPTISGGTVSEGNAGTYRYISGIPYYNTGNPTITISGIQVENFIGQTYADISNVLEVTSGTNLEGTTSAAIGTTNFTYAQINNSLISFLNNGIPIANTGIGNLYTLGAVSVAVTTSGVRTVDTIQYRMRNVNGTTSYLGLPSTPIQVHRSAQFGISEIAIAVSTSLGNGVFTDAAKRIFDFASLATNTPVFSSTGVNYYTANPYTETSDPGVVGTQEATIRLGVLEHNVVDYRTYLPAGPNRSGDTGTQYFTMSFRRQVVANFSISITSTTGVAGVWIAAPGTAIDSASTLNGWLDCSTQYAGAGVPGADTANGGNGSNGCAVTGADRITLNASISRAFSMTLGSENLSNSTDNVCLVRIALNAGQKITSLSIGV